MTNPRRKERPRGLLAGPSACAAALWLAAPTVSAQPSVEIKMLERAPTIDGEIGEDEWSGAAVIDEPFVQIEPEFGQASPFRTVLRIGQTDTALYIAFEAFDPEPLRLAAAVTQRDGNLDADDSVSIALDTFSDGRTALSPAKITVTLPAVNIHDVGRRELAGWPPEHESAVRAGLAATRRECSWVDLGCLDQGRCAALLR